MRETAVSGLLVRITKGDVGEDGRDLPACNAHGSPVAQIPNALALGRSLDRRANGCIL